MSSPSKPSNCLKENSKLAIIDIVAQTLVHFSHPLHNLHISHDQIMLDPVLQRQIECCDDARRLGMNTLRSTNITVI